MRFGDQCEFSVGSGERDHRFCDEGVPYEVEGLQGVVWQGTGFEISALSGHAMKWLQNECKILDVVSEKVAESDELADLTQIGRWWHV